MLTVQKFFKSGSVLVFSGIRSVGAIDDEFLFTTVDDGKQKHQKIEFPSEVIEIRVFDHGQKLMSVKWNGLVENPRLDVFDAAGNRLGEHRSA